MPPDVHFIHGSRVKAVSGSEDCLLGDQRAWSGKAVKIQVCVPYKVVATHALYFSMQRQTRKESS